VNILKIILSTIVLSIIAFFIAIYRIPIHSLVGEQLQKMPEQVSVQNLEGTLVEGSAFVFIKVNQPAVADFDFTVNYHWCPSFSQLLRVCIEATEQRLDLNLKVASSDNNIVLSGSQLDLKTVQIDAPIFNLVDVGGDFTFKKLIVNPKRKSLSALKGLNIVSDSVQLTVADKVIDNGQFQILQVIGKNLVTVRFEGDKLNLYSDLHFDGRYQTRVIRLVPSDQLPPLLSLIRFDSAGQYQTQGKFKL